MAIRIIRTKATPEELAEMLEPFEVFIKLAVDVRRRVLAGGGGMHADCEAVLLEEGSNQDDVWGADWFPADGTVGFGSLINIRPWLGNPSMRVQHADLRRLISEIARERLAA